MKKFVTTLLLTAIISTCSDSIPAKAFTLTSGTQTEIVKLENGYISLC